MNPSEETIPFGPQHVTVIDDEAVVGISCQRILSQLGHQVTAWQDPFLGMDAVRKGPCDVLLLDLVMDKMGGLEILKTLKQDGVTAEVIIITGYSTVETAVRAMKLGAADYVSKPFSPDELQRVFNRVLEHSALIRENAALRAKLADQSLFAGMVGESRAMQGVFSLIQRVAPTEGTVLITGESGTGKEMVAQAIHELSSRRGRPFLACDCGTLSPHLLESELFGHVKGSFSGALAAKKGLFEVADQGTLFLDELSNISLEIQGKLLRVLETRRLRKVGDTRETEINIRLIGATNRDLRGMVERREFREDLFYRLNVVPIQLPPLRERSGDIPILANRFLPRFAGQTPGTSRGFTPRAMELLENHNWPGNVRELKNMVERLAILSSSDRIDHADLPPEFQDLRRALSRSRVPNSWAEVKSLKKQIRDQAIRELESQFVAHALARSAGNVTRAAEQVGMQRTNFHALMTKYGLKPEASDGPAAEDSAS